MFYSLDLSTIIQIFSGEDLVPKSPEQVEEADRSRQRGFEPTIIFRNSTFPSKYGKLARSCCSCGSIRYKNMII